DNQWLNLKGIATDNKAAMGLLIEYINHLRQHNHRGFIEHDDIPMKILSPARRKTIIIELSNRGDTHKKRWVSLSLYPPYDSIFNISYAGLLTPFLE
ncbi:MAG: hypothetical protein GY705_30925, partial [Bacteroidetes bacterium]|nr:hypothetical protein [Bacteroidota bacterium]